MGMIFSYTVKDFVIDLLLLFLFFYFGEED